MNWYTFENYIEKYSNPNRQEWTVLFVQKKEETNSYNDDIFGFCALLDNNEKNIKSYLHDFQTVDKVRDTSRGFFCLMRLKSLYLQDFESLFCYNRNIKNGW